MSVFNKGEMMRSRKALNNSQEYAHKGGLYDEKVSILAYSVNLNSGLDACNQGKNAWIS
jgi:hypothetical protein